MIQQFHSCMYQKELKTYVQMEFIATLFKLPSISGCVGKQNVLGAIKRNEVVTRPTSIENTMRSCYLQKATNRMNRFI